MNFFLLEDSMKKRSLVLGFVVAMIAAFIFSGCESPTGSDGAQGLRGPGLAQPGQEITPEILAAWFKATDTVVLPAYTGETTISGVIPAGSKLVISGGSFVLKQQQTAANDTTPPEALLVYGGLVLEEGSALDAGYYDATVDETAGSGAGWLKLLDSGYLAGDGALKLPYIEPDVVKPAEGAPITVPEGLVHYDSAALGSLKKLPASYIGTDVQGGASKPVVELTHVGLTKIFELLAPVDESGAEKEGAINVFTTKIDTALIDNELPTSTDLGPYDYAVPVGKTLTLKGDGNVIHGTVAGELIVDGTLTETGSLNLPANGRLRVNGTLTVSTLDLSGENQEGALIVDGTLVSTGAVKGGLVEDYIPPEPGPDPDPTPDPTPDPSPSVRKGSVPYLESTPNYPANGKVNILIGVGGVLDLGTTGTASGITNDGTVTSASPDPDIVKVIIAGFDGSTDAEGAVSDTGKVELSGKLTAALGSASIALKQNVIVTGTLIVPETGTPFTGGKTITIEENGILSLGNAANITDTSFATTNVEIDNKGAVTTTATELATLQIVIKAFRNNGTIALEYDHLTVTEPLILTDNLSLTGSITIGNGGRLIAPNKEKPFVGNTVIDIGVGGTLELTADNTSFNGLSVDNKGVIATRTASADVLNTIVKLGGTVEVLETVAVGPGKAVIVPSGTKLTLGAADPAADPPITAGRLNITGNGKVAFIYGSSYEGIIGLDSGYTWVPDATYSVITLKAGGEIELTAGTFSYGAATLDDNLTIAEGTALTISGNVAIGTPIKVKGSLNIPSDYTVTINNVVTVSGTTKVLIVDGSGTVNVAGTLIDSELSASDSVSGKIVFERGSTGKLDTDTTLVGTDGVYQWPPAGTPDLNSSVKVTVQSLWTTLSGGAFTYGGDEITNLLIVDTGASLTLAGNAAITEALSVYGTLNIPAGKTLALGSDGFLRANGTVNVKGELDATSGGRGKLVVDGAVAVKYGGTYKAEAGALAGNGEVALESGSTVITTTTTAGTPPVIVSRNIAGIGDTYEVNWLAVAPYSKASLVEGEKFGQSTFVEHTGDAKLKGEITLAAGANLVFKKSLEVGGKVTVSKGATLGLPAPTDLTFVDTETAKSAIVFEQGSIGSYGGTGFIGLDDEYVLKWGAGTGGEVTLKSGVTEVKGELIAVKDAPVAKTQTLVIDERATFTISDGVTSEISGTLNVAETGKIVVEDGGTFTVATDGSGNLDGTITVKSGGTSYDKNPDGGSLWATDSSGDNISRGKYVFEAGAKAYVGGDNTIQANYRIGPDSNTTTALPIIALTDGTFTNSRTVYTLDGEATVRGNYSLTDHTIFKVAESTTLTVELKWDGISGSGPKGAYILNWAKFEGAADSKIVVKTPAAESITGGLIYITNDTDDGKGVGKNFYDNAGTLISNTGNYTVVPTGSYLWDASLDGGEGGWKAVDVTGQYQLTKGETVIVGGSETFVNVQGQPYLLDAVAVSGQTADGKPLTTITVASKPETSIVGVTNFAPLGSNNYLWGEKRTNAPAGNWSDLAIDVDVVFKDITSKVLSVKSTNHAYRYYLGSGNDIITGTTAPTGPATGSNPNIWVPANNSDGSLGGLPIKWKKYAANDLAGLDTWAIILWDQAPAGERKVTIEIYEYTTSGGGEVASLLQTLVIDYENVTIEAKP
jgi:hypothetical protein